MAHNDDFANSESDSTELETSDFDNQMRAAFARQHEDTVHQLASRPDALASVTSGSGPTSRRRGGRLLLAAALLVVVGLAGLVLSLRSDSSSVEIGDDEVTTTVSVTTTTEPPATTATPDEPATTNSDAADTSTAPTTSPPTTTASTSAPTTTALPEPTSPSSIEEPEEIGVENAVCASGFRAPLELAALEYVGPNQGWDRLGDLVNEQDGPHYYLAWEPNYPNEVTVRITLETPIDAYEIRLAQDPITDVAGEIEIVVNGETRVLPLSGKGGWVTTEFAEPRTVSSFTITRRQLEANIMEVLVCAA